jgi:phosphocarrier protein HPr
MNSRECTIRNSLGLHARPSAQVTQTAGKFQSEVWIGRDGRRVNAKSIMGVMMLAAGPGTVLLIEADGPDEQQAVQALADLIGEGFGE